MLFHLYARRLRHAQWSPERCRLCRRLADTVLLACPKVCSEQSERMTSKTVIQKSSAFCKAATPASQRRGYSRGRTMLFALTMLVIVSRGFLELVFGKELAYALQFVALFFLLVLVSFAAKTVSESAGSRRSRGCLPVCDFGSRVLPQHGTPD